MLKVMIMNLEDDKVMDLDAKMWPDAPADDAASYYKVCIWHCTIVIAIIVVVVVVSHSTVELYFYFDKSLVHLIKSGPFLMYAKSIFLDSKA